jgi:hypothetical protein
VFLKVVNLSLFILQQNEMHKVKNLLTVVRFDVFTVSVTEMMV